MRIFILGANDPEMREITRVLAEAGECFTFARQAGARVRARNAYDADGVSERLAKGAELIFIECSVRGMTATHVLDHHHPGDPGYECAPAEYLKGSSLGQLLTFLGKEPTALQRIICAADHCPDAAYRGKCPDVDTNAFAEWRLESKAAVKSIPVERLRELVEDEHTRLKAAERIDVAGTLVAWLPDATDEAPDASARYGIPFMYRQVERDGREKYGILGAPPEAIEAWMASCGLEDVYGAPSRGYAGGYRRVDTTAG
jgi:hypothetical protein